MESSHKPNEEQQTVAVDGPADAAAVARSQVVLLTPVGAAQPVLARALARGAIAPSQAAEIERRLAAPALPLDVFRGLADEPGARGVLYELVELLELDSPTANRGRLPCAPPADGRVCVA